MILDRQVRFSPCLADVIITNLLGLLRDSRVNINTILEPRKLWPWLQMVGTVHHRRCTETRFLAYFVTRLYLFKYALKRGSGIKVQGC